MSIYYTRYDSVKETVRNKKIEDGSNYNGLAFFHAAVASRDMPLIKYLIDREGINLDTITLRRLNFLGFRSKPLSIFEYAKKENFVELLEYLTDKREKNSMNEMIREQDDDVPIGGFANTGASSSSPAEVHSVSFSAELAASPAPPPPSQFRHESDASKVRSVAEAILERMTGKDVYLFQHQVDMSLVSIADQKRCAALAPRACWLLTCYLSIFSDLPVGASLSIEAKELLLSIGVIPPFTSVPYEDLEIYYQRHPFVSLIREKGAATDTRGRSKIVATFLSIVQRFSELYNEQFPEQAFSSAFASSSTEAVSTSPAAESTTPSSEPVVVIGTGNENPPEFEGIARGIFGTLGKDQKNMFSGSAKEDHHAAEQHE